MVIGLCLLIFFQTGLGQLIERAVPFTYTVYGVVLAQFVIGAAFAIRTMRGTFDHLSSRPEEVAMTLGCSRALAIWHVTLPAARRGMFAAGSVAWARSLGEFGPILVFAGATRMKTEVLPTTVWLELSVGNLEGAVAGQSPDGRPCDRNPRGGSLGRRKTLNEGKAGAPPQSLNQGSRADEHRRSVASHSVLLKDVLFGSLVGGGKHFAKGELSEVLLLFGHGDGQLLAERFDATLEGPVTQGPDLGLTCALGS